MVLDKHQLAGLAVESARSGGMNHSDGSVQKLNGLVRIQLGQLLGSCSSPQNTLGAVVRALVVYRILLGQLLGPW